MAFLCKGTFSIFRRTLIIFERAKIINFRTLLVYFKKILHIEIFNKINENYDKTPPCPPDKENDRQLVEKNYRFLL